MFCAISGTVPQEPVVSRKTGHVFEKRLITRVVESEGRCPITNEELSLDDLIEVQGNKAVPPRPPSATSIPGMLALFQNEWDALMLDAHTQKQHMEALRQELSQALYQHDAACRVIARLMRERDQARNALAAAQAQLAQMAASGASAGAAAPAAAATSGQEGIPKEVVKQMVSAAKDLSKGRKKRPVPEDLATEEQIKLWDELASHTIHKSDKPGIVAVDVHPTQQNLVLTAGVDRTAKLFNTDAGRVVSTLSGHSRALTAAAFHPSQDLMFTASADKTARVWAPAEGASTCLHVLQDHDDTVTGVSVQPTGNYFATASADNSWVLYDLAAGKRLLRTGQSVESGGFTCLQFHPDGMILGTGASNNVVRVWDMKTAGNVATFTGHTGAVSSISFSENGYYMASGSQDGSVKLWDLRKLKDVATLDAGAAVESVCFDFSGTYLAAAGADIRMFAVKETRHIRTLDNHTDVVKGVQFARNAQFLASVSMDRSLRVFGTSA